MQGCAQQVCVVVTSVAVAKSRMISTFSYWLIQFVMETGCYSEYFYQDIEKKTGKTTVM